MTFVQAIQKKKKFAVLGAGFVLLLGAAIYYRTAASELEIHFKPAPGESFQALKNDKGEEEVINHFQGEITNRSAEDVRLEPFLPPGPENKGAQLITAISEYRIPPGGRHIADIYLRFPRARLDQKALPIKIGVRGEFVESRKPLTRLGELTVFGGH